jgi:hypothetical protein
LIFIDETWATTNMTRLHGRCAKGQRLITKVPHGHRKTLTFVAGLRCDGIIARCVFDGPIDAESFLAWIVQCLVSDLRPGDIVVMDNLSSHKNKAAHDQALGRCSSSWTRCSPEMGATRLAVCRLLRVAPFAGGDPHA